MYKPTVTTYIYADNSRLTFCNRRRQNTCAYRITCFCMRPCLASPANFIYGRVLAKVLIHVTIMPVLLRPENNFLGQVIGNASEGEYNTVNNSSSGDVTFQKCLEVIKHGGGHTVTGTVPHRTFHHNFGRFATALDRSSQHS